MQKKTSISLSTCHVHQNTCAALFYRVKAIIVICNFMDLPYFSWLLISLTQLLFPSLHLTGPCNHLPLSGILFANLVAIRFMLHTKCAIGGANFVKSRYILRTPNVVLILLAVIEITLPGQLFLKALETNYNSPIGKVYS